MDTNSISLNRMNQLFSLNREFEMFFKNEISGIAKNIVPNFVFTDEIKELYDSLFLYFSGNNGKLDLNKGIYIYGEYGVGKTITMRIFNKFLQTYFNFTSNNFGITSIEEIAEYYKSTGNLLKFGKTFEQGKLICHNKCINELGKPLEEKYYGTNIQNVINSMLMVRYELFQEGKAITHATSNYHPGELECFDDAILDRFKEMFNFVELKGESFRN